MNTLSSDKSDHRTERRVMLSNADFPRGKRQRPDAHSKDGKFLLRH